jgi:hypothetical protein
MALTVPQIISIAKVSQYLAANDVAKGALFGARKIPLSPVILYMERKAVEWMYDLDPTDDTLRLTANYLYSLCRGYNLQAQNIINNGGGGSVSPVTPVEDIFPFIITSPDFESDGISYNNPDIVGVNLSIFINEVSQQWLTASSTTFSYTVTGIQILVPGFDANAADYTIMIQKLGSG